MDIGINIGSYIILLTVSYRDLCFFSRMYNSFCSPIQITVNHALYDLTILILVNLKVLNISVCNPSQVTTHHVMYGETKPCFFF